MALLTPVATKKTTTTSSATYTITPGTSYLILTNTDGTDNITVNVNGATAVAKEGIFLKAGGAPVVLNLKALGAVVKKISYIASANTPILAIQQL